MGRKDAQIHGRRTTHFDDDLVEQIDGTRTLVAHGRKQATLDVVHCTRVETDTREIVLVVVALTIDICFTPLC